MAKKTSPGNLLPLVVALVWMLEGPVRAQNWTNWPVTRIAAGGNHSLFIRSDGAVFGMGENSRGQLGLGSNVNSVNVPRFLTTGAGRVVAGGFHSLLVIGRGLWAMGLNDHGQLGDGTTNNHYVPEQVFSVSSTFRISTVAAGATHSLIGVDNFTTGAGTLYAMGDDQFGELGDGTFADHWSPEAILSYSLGQPSITAVAGGGEHSLFLKSDGSLWGMGYASSGQLGLGSPGIYSTNRPVVIRNSAGSPVQLLAAGNLYSLFATTDNKLWGMGANEHGQLGLADASYQAQYAPRQVVNSSLSEYYVYVTAVAAGGSHTLFIKPDGSLWAVGDQEYGQLGDGISGYGHFTDAPEMIVASNVVAVAAGTYHSLFLKSDGSLWGMGYNGGGELGTGDYLNRSVPTLIVSAPPQLSILANAPNVVLVWGTNAVGFKLQATGSLVPPVTWTNVASKPVVIGGQNAVFLPAAAPRSFYRLSQ